MSMFDLEFGVICRLSWVYVDHPHNANLLKNNSEHMAPSSIYRVSV